VAPFELGKKIPQIHELKAAFRRKRARFSLAVDALAPSADRQSATDQSGFFTALSIELLVGLTSTKRLVKSLACLPND
jgi:hypothetical protein